MPCNNSFPFDPSNLVLDQLFSNIQGNILKAHGRPFTRNIFFKFTAPSDKAKAWLKTFGNEKITSCKSQLKEIELYKRNNISGGVFISLLLTAKGYQHLGFDTSVFNDKSFQAGMAASQSKLNDRRKSEWDLGFQQEIHGLVLIAYHDENILDINTDEVNEQINQIAIIWQTENGTALHNKNGDGIEHFGYVDGTSQPLFFRTEIDEFNDFSYCLAGFDPVAANKELQVLTEDPLVINAKSEKAYGSYFVFRKLDQDVRGFKTAERILADDLGLLGTDVERAGAMIVGRFEDGTPVTLSQENGMVASGKINGFSYDQDYRGDGKKDIGGGKCPFHSHIRKVNPRDGSESNEIMARRGIPYGGTRKESSFDNLEEMPTKDVGLLFQSYQASIKDQFERIQARANDNVNGHDPVIGQPAIQKTGDYPVSWGDPTTKQPGAFGQFVTLRGGEYFFAPSLPFFKNL